MGASIFENDFNNQTEEIYLPTISQIWSSFILFIILYYGRYRETMSFVQMISTIQLLKFLILLIKQQLFQTQKIKKQKKLDKNQQISESEYLEIKLFWTQNSVREFASYWTTLISENTKAVFKNLTLEIYSGETWAFIGRVGCGKFTLLSALQHEISVYSGSFKIELKEANKSILLAAYFGQESFIQQLYSLTVLISRPILIG